MTKRKSAAAAREPQPSQIWCQLSDVHYDITDMPTYRAITQWVDFVKPDVLVANGDMIDLGALSKYTQDDDAQLCAIDQIKMFVREMNWFRERCGRVIFSEGNHEARWSRVVGALAAAGALRGAKGLTLKEQCLAHGLDDRIEWRKESKDDRGVRCGQFILRHGDRQAGRFGGAKHLAMNAIDKAMGASLSFGHHHVGQLVCKTSLDRTAIALANPGCVRDQNYHPDSNHQLGFSIFELMAPDFKVATPHLIIALDGRFSHAGLTYDGNV